MQSSSCPDAIAIDAIQPPIRSRAVLPIPVLLLALIPSFVKIIYYPHNIGSDDAFIHLQVARNLANGHGWALNSNQPVNISTSPLYTMLVTVLDRIDFAHAIGIAQLLTCVAGAAGLLLIFLRVRGRASAKFQWIPFAATAIPAFSLNLWRWNGDVMEATVGFFFVSLILFLFRDWRTLGPKACFRNGIVLGLSFLVRPELILALFLCAVLIPVLGKPGTRVSSPSLAVGGATLVIAPWLYFCHSYFGAALPTAFYAKASAPPVLWNPEVLRQFIGLAVESYFWPSLLLLILTVLAVRTRGKLAAFRDLLLPVGLVCGIFAFHYLRTRGLESPGRYLLPFEACVACIVGVLLNVVTDSHNERRRAILVGVFLGLHAVTAIALNHTLLAPVLEAFNMQYRATMTDAAAYLSAHTARTDNVLAAEDIGVVSWVANGRFRIYDTQGLSAPAIRQLDLRRQIAVLRPKYFVFSLDAAPDYLPSGEGNLLQPVWRRRFKQHGLWASLKVPYNYTTICWVNRQDPPALR